MATNKNLSTTNNSDNNVVNSTNSKSNYKYGHRNSMNNPNTRLIRSFALFDNRDFLPRPFQIELYETCKNRDTIVFLRPGQGKYFISVMLVKYFNPHLFPSDNVVDLKNPKKIFFLAKSPNSIKLYSSVFNAHCNLRIGEYIETDDAKQWSPDIWHKKLQSYDIHLMMDCLFEYLIEQKLIHANDLNLLILNDVHKILLCTSPADDCYTKIIHRLRLQTTNEKQYRILGLSASILLENVSSNVFEKMIEQIEKNLCCSCETYADLRMISKYSIQCRIKLRSYYSLLASEKSFIQNDIKYRMALFMIRNYSGQFFNFITNVSMDGGITTEQLINHETIAKMIVDILNVYGILGEWCALKLIDLINRELYDTILLMSKTASNYLRLLNSCHSTLCLIRKSILSYMDQDIVAKYENTTSSSSSSNGSESQRLTIEQFLLISSPKLHLLAQVLIEYLEELSSPSSTNQQQQQTTHSSFTFPSNICSLIYVENRLMARVLNEWIRELIAIVREINSGKACILDFLQSDYVFLAEDDGKNELKNFYYRKHQKSLHEIYYYRQQEETLRRFRLPQQCNVLITTSMSSEGLDVNRCNMVICFDIPKTFHQFIQSKGRVRVERGQFIVLVEQNDHKDYVEKFLQFCNIEKIFTKLVPLNNQVYIENEPKNIDLITSIQSIKPIHSSSLKSSSIVQKSKKFDKQQQQQQSNQSATLQLTLENAISILNRYCNKLPSDTFTKLVPNYKIESVKEEEENQSEENSEIITKYRCRLFLPINSTYRDEIVGNVQPTQSLAKQSVAFEAIKTLREIGELDQNFYPVGKETSRYIEKLGLQDCFINIPKNNNNNQQVLHQHQQQQPQHQHHHHHRGPYHQKGNRFNRIQNRNIASKRRQYFKKKVADSLCGQIFSNVDNDDDNYCFQYLYEFQMKLTYRLSEEHNTRGRRIIDPAETTRTFGIISPNHLPTICDFTIYNRSGEVTVSIVPIRNTDLEKNGFEINEIKRQQIENFHQYTFENVLPLGKSSIRFDRMNGSNGNYLIVPINTIDNGDQKTIDWEFLELIWHHKNDPKSYDQEKFHHDDQNRFIFEEKLYQDAVVIPKYRKDKLQSFYYVAEICHDLTPQSPFPDHEYQTFEKYYNQKYEKQITNLEQPLLDVDHTSARLNLLTPRFLNRRGINLSSSSSLKSSGSGHHQSKRNPQQKQILVPELCFIHPFPASFWRKAVCLPCILYRLNLLLIAEELRFKIAKEAKIGVIQLPDGEKWPKLDFGWSVLVEQSRQQTKSIECASNNNQHSNLDDSNEKQKTTINQDDDFIIDTFDPSMAPPASDQFFNENQNNFINFDSYNNEMIPQIEIISGPFNESKMNYNNSQKQMLSEISMDDDFDEEESGIIEVDNENNPIIQPGQKLPVRAGSPTYWKDRENLESDRNGKIPADFDWRFYESDGNDNESNNEEIDPARAEFRLNFKKFLEDIQQISKMPSLVDDDDEIQDNEHEFEEFDNKFSGNNRKKSSRNNNNQKRKPMVTSLSDLDDDDDDDDGSYSDFDDLDDSSDDYDQDDDDDDLDDDGNFNSHDEDDDDDDYDYSGDDDNGNNDDDDDDLDNFPKKYSKYKNRKAKTDFDQKIRKLSQTMDAYQTKSVIYDILKIELLYDSRQIEQKSLKYYYRHRFSLAEQHSEHLRKRKIFDEMYFDEKNQVMQCVQRIQNETLMNENSKSKNENDHVCCDPEIDTFRNDKNFNEINLNQSLLSVLMEKIDTNLLDMMKIKHEIEDEKIDQQVQNRSQFANILGKNSSLSSTKIEVKFGELLPNRDENLAEFTSNDKNPIDLFQAQRKLALQTLPRWLQLENSFETQIQMGPHPSLILQAITMSNSSDGINLERLETVGDSFLKYSITAFLFCMLDNWCPPSYQALDNVEQESNDNVKTTTSNKVPYNLLTQHSIPNKSIADCVEALIGTYLISSGSQGAIQFMDWLGLKVLPKGMKIITKNLTSEPVEHKDDSNQNHERWLPQPRSPLIIPKHLRNDIAKVKEIEDKLQRNYYKHHLDRFEEIIGYRFRDRAYLVQAFTHNSYYENKVTDCYQRLEFLGDAVLDYLITRYLYEDPRCHSPGTLTDLRSALVNNTFFAALAVKYNFHKYLMMLSSELYRVIDGFVRKFNIYYNQNLANGESKKILSAISDFQQGNEDDERMDENSYSNYNYWELFVSENEAEHLEDIEVPKALGDIFESVAGAIYLDSDMSLEAVWKAYYPMMKPEIENFSEKVPKSPIRVLLEKQPQSVKFGKPEINSGRRIRVTVEVFGLGKFVGIGRNKRIAKCTAAKRALRALESEKRRKELERKRRQMDEFDD
uniref:Endoribonuclease Dicer-like n=1 Tax=Dermatophagoides pteronyssinus TaxID=6956 RepID=A0A6P6XVR2_DERPT|nr:endoribonuclease Dicer-like [Dermatophagoides pteronyssinus]